VKDENVRAYTHRSWHVTAALKQEHWARELARNPLATFEASQALWVIPRYLPGAFPVAVDVFPFTRDEITDRAPSPVLDAVARSGWRYARHAAG
jgi:hypothetical protein